MRPKNFCNLAFRLTVCALAVSPFGLIATQTYAAQKLPPGTNGFERCVIEEDGDGSGGSLDNASNRCCYEDKVAEGEYLTMCIKCDSEWKNCTEEPGNPKTRFRILPRTTTGTVSEPAGTQGIGRTTTTTGRNLSTGN